jgi:hypothetical protein
MAGFFVADSGDVLYEPFSSFLMGEGVDDVWEDVFFSSGFNNIGSSGVWETVSLCSEFFCEGFFCFCAEAGLEFFVDGDGAFCVEVCCKDAKT